jgi:hypothetical protein
MLIFFLNIVPVMRLCKLLRAGQAIDDNMAHTIACWIPKATILGIFNTYCFSTATMVARARFMVTLYVHSCHFFDQCYPSDAHY